MVFNAFSRLHYFLSDFFLYLVIDAASILIFLFLSYVIFKSRNSTRKKGILIAFLSFLLAFVAMFSFFEAYIRYRYDESDSLGFLKISGRWFNRHVQTNNYFFRDRTFVDRKKEGTIRIGVMGDSLAFGYGIKDVEKRFSNILEKKLQDGKYNVEVYNLSRSGYDTTAEIQEFNKMKFLNFDILVWEYYINDAQPQFKSAGTQVLTQERLQGPIMKAISEKSYLIDYLYWRLASRYEKTFQELRNADFDAYKDEKNMKRHKKEIDNFITDLQSQNTKVVVIMFPAIKFINNYPGNNVHKTMETIFTSNGVEFIDLLKDLKGKNPNDLMVGKFDYHPNEYVHQIAADKLYNSLVPIIKEIKNKPQ